MNLIEDIFGFVFNKTAIVKNILRLVKLEAKLAGMSVIPLLIKLFLFFVVLLGTWLTAMFFLGYGIFQLYNSILIATLSVLTLNFILISLLLKGILTNIKHMSFTETRKLLMSKDGLSEQIEEISDQSNSQHSTGNSF